MPNTTVRNLLLVLLTMTSGCVDAISFLKLGEVFTAAMTGNTVLFGLAVAHTDGQSFVGYAVALVGFILGASTGAIVLRRVQKTTGWAPLVTISIGIELLALVAFAVVVSIAPQTAETGIKTDFLIALLAFAMGVQGVAARRIGVNGVTTTVITSTLTGLVETAVWKISAAVLPSSSQRSNRDGESQKVIKNTTSVLSMSMWILVIVFYGVGAAICGALILHWNLEAVWLPVAIVFVVIVTATVPSIRAASGQKAEISM